MAKIVLTVEVTDRELKSLLEAQGVDKENFKDPDQLDSYAVLDEMFTQNTLGDDWSIELEYDE
jgi:hypothetical protein